MNNSSETQRLAAAVASIASTIAKLIDAKLRSAIDARVAGNAPRSQMEEPAIEIESWKSKKQMAAHFNVSTRTIDEWMRKGYLPYFRIGRQVRFKKSDVDEAMNRNFKINGRY
jgi:excisionase family DNA binding protein